MNRRMSVGVAVAAAIVAGSVVSTVVAQDRGAAGASSAPGAQQPPRNGAMGFPNLVEGLKAVEGCMGVEVAQTGSGKQVIFAWFEDKEAAKRWYYSDMHRGVMQRFGGISPDDREPLEHVPDDVPVLTIASVTPATEQNPGPGGAPFSQIAIELYTPLPGGVALGGSFSPESLKVQDLERF